MNKEDGKKASEARKSNHQESQRKISANKEQNLKQFKVNIPQMQLQIDHEIAKCLDTLDRQGLKYLKETLRASNIFDLEDLRQETAKQDRKDKKKDTLKAKNNSDQIEEQIVEECDMYEDPDPNVTRIGINSSKPLEYQPPQKVKLQKFQQVIQEPLKPFSRKGTRSKLQPSSQVDNKIIPQKPKLPSKPKQQTEFINDKSQIDMIVEKISSLPQQKLHELGKIIDRLEKNQAQQEFPKTARNPQGYMFKVQAGMLSNHSARPTSNNKKKQKATSLHDCIIKNKRGNTGSGQNSPKNQNEGMKQQIQQQIIDTQNIAIEEPKTQVSYSVLVQSKGSPLVDEKKEKQPKKAFQFNNSSTKDKFGFKKSGFGKNFPMTSSLYKKPLDIEITQSRQAQTIEMSQNKMVKLGKKKLGTNKVQIILIRNRGHPSVIGLTGIQFYNSIGKSIPITVQHVKAPNSIKVMKLFNGINKTTNQQQMFTTIFKRDFQIELEVPEKIGALKIWNYNKSEIESEKQTDWIEIYINGKEAWQGLIQKGSYNELQNYQTNIQIQEGLKIQQQSQQDSPVKEQIPIQKTPSFDQLKKSFNLGKMKEGSKKKIDWLETTLVQQKLKQLKQKDQQKPLLEQKRTLVNPARFSQIYNESNAVQQPLVNIKMKKQQGSRINLQKRDLKGSFNFKKQEKQSIQKKVDAKKEKNKKIEEQFDIFNSMAKNQTETYKNPNKIEILQNKKDSPVRKPIQSTQQVSLVPEIVLDKPQAKIIKKTHEKSLDQFMNDSLFQDQSDKNQSRQQNLQKIMKKPSNPPPPIKEQPIQKQKQQVNLDDFLNELDDLVGGKKQKKVDRKIKHDNSPIYIPEHPKGSKIEILIDSNWGDSQYIGLNKIEFFTDEGTKICPIQVKQSSGSQNSIFFDIFSNKKGINHISSQWKCQKKGQISIEITFSKKFSLALIRFWNYIGDRIQSMIGIKRVKIFFDEIEIFKGEIRKMVSSSIEEEFKSCENILFTSNLGIMKKIANNDWLSQHYEDRREQTIIFKKTVEGFHRPNTKGELEIQKNIEEKKIPMKIPKRQCFQYDPPQNPSGYFLKIILHSAWGDRSFIGLNGLIIFDEKGNSLKNIHKMTEFPSPLNTMPGYQGDKRILKNLLDGKNFSNQQQHSWLSAQLSDIQKMEKKSPNTILIQFSNPVRISGINFYNYTKTPERGVRQVQIYLDKLLCFRGYLRKANIQTGEIHTTINFTKQPQFLQKINYNGYHQDNLCQEVSFYNEGRVQEVK